MSRRIVAVVAMICALWGLSWRPAQAYVGISIRMGAPGFLLSFGQNLNAFYAPRYSTYVYIDNGLYYRWVDDGWVYSRMVEGPWWPLAPAVYLPPLLAYGPPPPIVVYRPYFAWWRARVAPWYAQMHPIWWMRHRGFVAHYGLWRTRIIPFYQDHPGILWRRPVGRVIFTRPFVQRQMWWYTLHHPEFAEHHQLLRQRAMRYARFHPGFVRRGPFMPARRDQRFRADEPRFRGRPDGAHEGFRDRRDWRGRGRH
ncbi:MAG: hypothetical protein M0Z76_03245 [Gammaproteobacteria bacterium]|nr:hypothetical protein [Gammaproteobacteria bacterium]